MLLEEVLVYGGVSFQPPCTSRVHEEIRVRVTGQRNARAASVLPYLLSFLVALKSARGFEILTARFSAKRCLFFGVTPGSRLEFCVHETTAVLWEAVLCMRTTCLAQSGMRLAR